MLPDPQLPNPDDIEQALAGRSSSEPPRELRGKILAAVSAQRQLAPNDASGRGRSAICPLAAAVVLALNVALAAINGWRYEMLQSRMDSPAPVVSGHPADTDERLRYFAVSALAQLKPVPDADAIAQRFFEQEEN